MTKAQLVRNWPITVVAMLAAIATTVWWPRTNMPVALGDVLESASNDSGEAKAVCIRTRTDLGPDTEVRDSWTTWIAAGLGHRTEMVGQIEVYDQENRREGHFDPSGKLLTLVKDQETSIGSEFLRRSRISDCVEYMIIKARQPECGIESETLDFSGVRIQRLSCVDEYGHDIVVELDPARNRILRTESWTVSTKHDDKIIDPVRVVTKYEYPDIDAIDRSLFHVPDPDARTVVATDDQAALQQCMINIRDILGAFFRYEDDHSNGIPDDIAAFLKSKDGFRESMMHCPLTPADRTFQYQIRFPNGARSLVSAHYSAVIIECTAHQKNIVRGFADGHCESVKR